ALNTLTDDVLGQLLAKQPQLGENEKEFLRKVLRLYEEFAAAEGNTEFARFSKADGCYRVALLYRKLGEAAAGESAYRDAIALYGELLRDFPSEPAYRQGLGNNHIAWGAVMYQTNRTREAEGAWRAAADTFTRLADDFPNEPAYRFNLSRADSLLGVLLRE